MLARLKRAAKWRLELATGYNVKVPAALQAAYHDRAARAAAVDVIAKSDTNPAIVDQAVSLMNSGKLFRFCDHKAIMVRGSAAEKLCFYAASRTLLGRQVSADRSAMLAELNDIPGPLDSLSIERAAGILVVPPLAWPVLTDAAAEAQLAFETGEHRARTDRKTYMHTTSIPGDPMKSKIMALATHPSMLRLVGRYLDGLPILYRINLIKSDNAALEDGSSQFHHLDPEEFRQVKVFLLVSDVDDESGPLHLLRADASDQVQIKLNYRPRLVPDETVSGIVGNDPLVKCVGTAGTMAIGDTSRCFHFGSRPGKRERYVVMIQYITPFAAEFPIDAKSAGGKFSSLAARNEFEQYLMGAKR